MHLEYFKVNEMKNLHNWNIWIVASTNLPYRDASQLAICLNSQHWRVNKWNKVFSSSSSSYASCVADIHLSSIFRQLHFVFIQRLLNHLNKKMFIYYGTCSNCNEYFAKLIISIEILFNMNALKCNSSIGFNLCLGGNLISFI